MRIAILGAGAWGTALAVSLAPQHAIALWSRNALTRAALAGTRCHPSVLSGVYLPDSVAVRDSIEATVRSSELVIVAVAVAGARGVLGELARLAVAVPVILACKGFERDSGLLPHALARQLLGPAACVMSLSGPSFASEVAAGQPTALVLAGDADEADPDRLGNLAQALHHPRLRIYSNTDPVGVELAGALKNVIAIAAGMCDGMGLGLNARAALITRGLAEIRRLGEHLGARPETFLGLAGVGDLLLTCTATLSRNYRVGQGLAAGTPLADILRTLGEVAEGVSTAQVLAPIAARLGVDMPICSGVRAVLAGTHTPASALQGLLGRDPRAEA